MTRERQLEAFPTDLSLRRIDPAKGMRRFYRMTVQPDLFGGAGLVREWGRLGSPGRVRVDMHPDQGRAVSALMELARVKTRRGYAPT